MHLYYNEENQKLFFCHRRKIYRLEMFRSLEVILVQLTSHDYEVSLSSIELTHLFAKKCVTKSHTKSKFDSFQKANTFWLSTRFVILNGNIKLANKTKCKYFFLIQQKNNVCEDVSIVCDICKMLQKLILNVPIAIVFVFHVCVFICWIWKVG